MPGIQLPRYSRTSQWAVILLAAGKLGVWRKIRKQERTGVLGSPDRGARSEPALTV